MILIRSRVCRTRFFTTLRFIRNVNGYLENRKKERLKDDRGAGISSAAVFEAMNVVTPSNAVIACDVGNNTYSFGRYSECKEQAVLMSGYLGSIGFALPAAMGAWAAVRDSRPVWSLSGDGGLGLYLTEITTLVKYNMPIKHVLLNNSELGKMSKEQSSMFGRRACTIRTSLITLTIVVPWEYGLKRKKT